MEQFVGDWIAGKIGVLVCYGSIVFCRIKEDGKKKTKLWRIIHKASEEVTIVKLCRHQRLYLEEKSHDPKLAPIIVKTCTVKKKPPPLLLSKKKKPKPPPPPSPPPLSSTTIAKNSIPTDCIEPVHVNILTNMTNKEVQQELKLRRETVSRNKIELQTHLSGALLNSLRKNYY